MILGQILGMSLSPDGTLLATYSNMGSAQIWEMDTYQQVQSLRDQTVRLLCKIYIALY